MSKKSPPASSPPAPLPEVHIIELSCSQENSVSNAEWSVILPKGINIDDGDQISIKTGFVNQSALTGGNIDIPEDITIAMEVGFYVINGIQFCEYSSANNMQYYFYPQWVAPFGEPTDINMVTGVQQGVPTDGEMYIWHTGVPVTPQNPAGYAPIIERTEIPLKAGSYTPQQISTIITSRLSSMNGQVLQGDQTTGGIFELSQLKSGSRFLQNATTNIREADSWWLASYTQSAWDAATVRRFRYEAQVAGAAPLAPANTNDATYFVGATQLALDYDDVSEAFQWSFLHTPMADPASSGSVANALYRSTFKYNGGADQYTGPLKYQTRQSGVFFTKLEPESFWEALGFSIGETVVDISDGVSTTEVNAKTTDNQLGLSTIISRAPQAGLIVVNQNYDDGGNEYPTVFLQYLANSNILPLKAQNTYSANNSGFYLVSLDLGTINSFSDDNKVYGGISGIVGKYFESNDFVTIMGDSAIPYIHNGASFTLSNVRVRILDQNKDPVRGLRGNSSIFLQIIKGAS